MPNLNKLISSDHSFDLAGVSAPNSLILFEVLSVDLPTNPGFLHVRMLAQALCIAQNTTSIDYPRYIADLENAYRVYIFDTSCKSKEFKKMLGIVKVDLAKLAPSFESY